MHVNAQRLLSQGFKQHWSPPEYEGVLCHRSLRKGYSDKFVDSLATIHGSQSYLPALVPDDANWMERVIPIVRQSFAELIADIWTQILVTKRDAREKPLYLFWDDEVPKPTRFTALAWLLTCEAWPMPNHRTGENADLFPPQPFWFPHSTPYGFTGATPYGFAEGETRIASRKTMIGLFAESLHRGDRDNMAKAPASTIVYRPRPQDSTALGFHISESIDAFEHRYATNPRWAINSHGRIYDQGLASYEIAEANYHLRALANLRREVMSGVLTSPGMPTHPDALHNSTGMTIRSWSESGLAVSHANANANAMPLHWTPANDSIKLEHGITIQNVPTIAPRAWFGFTHIGPDYSKEGPAIHTASERWTANYLVHRDWAIRSLFTPDSIDLIAEANQSASARAQRLERAGRLKKTSAATNNGFAAAFASLMKKED